MRDYDRLRLKVTRIRVSLSTPQLATAAVRALNRSGRQVLPTAIVVLSRSAGAGRRKSGHWSFDIGPATSFPDSCGPAVEVGLRDLLCPSPWVVLGYRHSPRIPSGLGFTTPAGTTNIRAVRWGDVTVPGSACGGDQPIHLRHGGAYTKRVAESWWPAIAVYGGHEVDRLAVGVMGLVPVRLRKRLGQLVEPQPVAAHCAQVGRQRAWLRPGGAART